MPVRALPDRPPSRASAGFGLIELIIVVAILAILAAIGVPSFNQTMQSNRVQTEANELVSAISTARGEAITRSRRVTLCPSADGASCNAGQWATPNQWIVFTDYGATGVVEPGSGDTVLRVWKQVDKGDTVGMPDGAVQWLSFDRAGHGKTDNNAINTSPGAKFQLTVTAQGCKTGSKNKRVITVQLLGRVSTDSDSC